MIKVIGYTYEADEHCPKCAHERFAEQSQGGLLDEHDIPIYAIDREGNTIMPRFNTDDVFDDVYCGSCDVIIANAA